MRRRDFLRMGAQGVLLVPVLLRAQQGDARAAEDAQARVNAGIANLEKELPGKMQAGKVPGASVAVISRAKIVWRRGFGFKDAAARLPVDQGTMFEAASMSKPVFAYAVMKLCEKGVLDLDAPLTRYTKERFLEGDPRLDLITVRRVLCHTTGFQNWRSEKDPLAIHFTPGEKFQYSGEGYSYLQSVVEQVTGEPIQQYMKRNLFEPFDMRTSGYVWSEEFARRMARPHDVEGKAYENKKSTPADVARYGSSGALLTTPTDYAKFLIEVLDPRPADAFRLNRRSIEEMLRPQIRVAETPDYTVSWGLGWRLVHSTSGDMFGHGGDNEGFHCESEASRAMKSGIVIMTDGERGGFLLQDLLKGKLLKPFVDPA